MSDKKAQKQELQKQYLEELQKDPRVQSFMEPYKKRDITGFLKHYAKEKAQIKINGNHTENDQKFLMKTWIANGWQCLREIQNKKLFDQQCQKHIDYLDRYKELGYLDFTSQWGKEILDNNSIPDITQKEVEDYIDFLESRAGTLYFKFYRNIKSYQDYDYVIESVLKGKENTGIAYYDYIYEKYGGVELLKPLQTIKKERNIAETPPETDTKPPEKPVKRYVSTYTYDERIKLAEHLEERNMAHFLKDLEKFEKERYDLELEFAIDYLIQCHQDDVPITEHHNWQKAFYHTYLKHRDLKTAEHLPSVYQMYLIKKQTGISIREEDDF